MIKMRRNHAVVLLMTPMLAALGASLGCTNEPQNTRYLPSGEPDGAGTDPQNGDSTGGDDPVSGDGDHSGDGDIHGDADPLDGPHRLETFDSEPSWVGVSNQPGSPSCVQVDQDFGYSSDTSFGGGSTGEIGGKMWLFS